jgi:hypothetical protein
VKDMIVVGALVFSFALLVTVHVVLLWGLAFRKPRWRALVAFVVPISASARSCAFEARSGSSPRSCMAPRSSSLVEAGALRLPGLELAHPGRVDEEPAAGDEEE